VTGDSETLAANALALKENPLLAEILDEAENDAVASWKNTPVVDGEKAREKAWMMLKSVERIRTLIDARIDAAKIAKFHAEQRR
jgi:hypothetical protein